VPERALVKNAADEGQVREAEKRERFTRRDELDDLRMVLETKQGRRLLWRLMTHCRVFESIYHASALIHYNAGMQDVGHFLLAEITSASSGALMTMMQEQQKEQDNDSSRAG